MNVEKKWGVLQGNCLSGKVYYFRCSTYTKNARLGLCTSHNIRMDIVEKAVNNKILCILKKFFNKNNLIKVTKQKIEEKKKSISLESEIETYRTKLNKISLEIDSIYNDKLSGLLSEDDFIRIYERKKQEKENLQKKIDEIQLILSKNVINEDELIKNIVNEFQGLKEINREILNNLIDRIEIDKDKNIYIIFKFKTINP